MLAEKDESQGEECEVEALDAQCHRGDQRAYRGCHETGRRQPDEHAETEPDHVCARIARERGADVRSDTEKERMAERDLSRVAGHQVEPDRTDRRDEGGRQKDQPRPGETEEREDEDHTHAGGQSDSLRGGRQDRPIGSIGAVEVRSSSHTRSTSSVPNSPYGLISSTMSITRYGITWLKLLPSHGMYWAW
ncbi:hypothetical protein BMS3Bbin01_02775 [bacterium BMS3Bbin01]|nr:hypothetical protein BMS3Bbin01_02775 [bacterium BMS3Bbin01]